MIKRISGYFVKGLLFILPILLGIYLVRIIITLIVPFTIGDSFLLNFIIALFLVTLLGFLVSKGVNRYFRSKYIATIGRIPLLGNLFHTLKRLFTALKFSQDIFNKPVMIKREQGKEIKFGFLTGNMEEFGLKGHSSVYIPNPFSFLGEITIVEDRYLKPIKGDKEKVINFILSGGIINK